MMCGSEPDASNLACIVRFFHLTHKAIEFDLAHEAVLLFPKIKRVLFLGLRMESWQSLKCKNCIHFVGEGPENLRGFDRHDHLGIKSA